MSKPSQSINIIRISLCLLCTLAMLLHLSQRVDIPFVTNFNNQLYDLRLRLSAPQTLDERIVILDIDEKSLLKEGRWPWPRDKMSYLIDLLFDYYQISILGMDIVFAEEDKSSGLDILNHLGKKQLAHNQDYQNYLQQVTPQLQYDQLFAKSLKNRLVILGYYTSPEENKLNPLSTLPQPLIQSSSLDFTNLLYKEKSYGANLSLLQNSAYGGGFFSNPALDSDGVFRRVPLLIEYQDNVYETLSLAMLRGLFQLQQVDFEVTDGLLEKINLEGLSLPVDARSNILVPYRGRAEKYFTYVSATDVLSGELAPDLLSGKIVIMGTTAPGLKDLRTTPVQEAYPGVEVHANMLSGMLDKSIKSSPRYIQDLELITSLLIGVFCALVFLKTSALITTICYLMLLTSVVTASSYLWIFQNLATNMGPPIALLTVLYGIQTLFSYFSETRRKQMLSNMFGHYIPPELVKSMSKSEEQFTTQGESRELTVLFSDIRGFTSLSENLEATELCVLINDILTPITRVIHEHNGTIDKYMGDAVMAFWGAPITDQHHANHGVATALNLVETLHNLTDEFAEKGYPPIKMGIGLNSGKMSVGNMGSEFRLAYTVMGDAVNLGSRLEGLTKQYGVDVIVSEFTKEMANAYFYKELDMVRVKGKLEPITIYEPICLRDNITDRLRQEDNLLLSALKAFRQQNWTLAISQFEQLRLEFQDHLLYRMYLERIELYRQEPPGDDWDGVFTHQSK